MTKTLCSVVLLLVLQGCASLTEGTTQVVSLNNLPEKGCTVNGVYLNPNWNKVQVQKSKEALEIYCEDETKIVESTVSSAGVTSILFLDFGIVDTLTGAMWKYPSDVNYDELEKLN